MGGHGGFLALLCSTSSIRGLMETDRDFRASWPLRHTLICERPGKPLRPAPSLHRFRDNGCLRYSLRALWRYAPWIDKIHLVTAGERPAWLDPDHRSVRLVRHEEIFPSQG